MRIYVPYTYIQPATRIALHGYAFTPIDVRHSGYVAYWKERWVEAQTFINVEHDVIPWPGALDELDACPGDWCAFGYGLNDNFADRVRSGFPYLGCVKFSAGLIRAFPGVWDDAEDWQTLDRHIARALRASGRDVCQHRPAVVNANPLRLH